MLPNNLLQNVTILRVEMFLLTFRCNILTFNLCHCLIFPLGSNEKSLAASLLPSIRVLVHSEAMFQALQG